MCGGSVARGGRRHGWQKLIKMYRPSRPMRRRCAQAWKASCHAALSASRCEPESRGASGLLPKYSLCHPTKSLKAFGGSLVGCHSGRTSCARQGGRDRTRVSAGAEGMQSGARHKAARQAAASWHDGSQKKCRGGPHLVLGLVEAGENNGELIVERGDAANRRILEKDARTNKPLHVFGPLWCHNLALRNFERLWLPGLDESLRLLVAKGGERPRGGRGEPRRRADDREQQHLGVHFSTFQGVDDATAAWGAANGESAHFPSGSADLPGVR